MLDGAFPLQNAHPYPLLTMSLQAEGPNTDRIPDDCRLLIALIADDWKESRVD